MRTSARWTTAFLLLAAGGCASTSQPVTEEPPPPAVEPEPERDPDPAPSGPTPADLAALEEGIARLEIMLLARDVQVAELQTQLDQTRRELVRNMAMLQSQASRAEAASGMAEAETAREALARVLDGTETPEFARVGDLIDESTREFNRENYAGALYLANEARTLARTARSLAGSSDDGSLAPGEEAFALPVPLQTVSRSNIRSGPGLGHEILFTLDPGTELTGRAHTNQWLRVLDGQGREGWIFHTLVSAVPR